MTTPTPHHSDHLPVPTEHYQQEQAIPRTTLLRWERLGLRILRVSGKRFICPSDWTRVIEARHDRTHSDSQ